MKKIIDKIFDIIFPKRCVFCGKKLDTEYIICLCEKCRDKAFTKHIEKRQFEKRFFEKIICCMDYTGFARKSFLKYKFGNLRYLKDTYAKMMHFKIKNDDCFLNADFVISVPLSKERLNERGFNQSQLIAENVSSLLDKPFFKDVLIKTKNTKPFSKMNAEQRRRIVRGSYIFNSKYDVKDKSIILIDDIYTSGATMNECSKILKMYGARSVYCAALFNSVGRREK